ncbi:ribonuclease, Rne/Rng family [Kribbella flavida DSM 17836]|uniref:Ribonuclease E n=1 Tax=Kribbella flavida (strain DSM 17836 / JCM 10339 / NBRC 14399) TaxID=479435 RepID=D2PUT1_KRIFD|nr:Rne/Rng family ribonuclease [Kribbella flavida]ADB31397.1 ribonuclease, Rne/Rng family [Kribbella flavida DSM 17836]
MLDNEPNTTEAADVAATDQPARKAGARKTAAKKTAVKSSTPRKRTVKKAAASAAEPAEAAVVSTQSDAEAADPAPAPVKKTAARKTAAKAPAKKAAAKTAAKRTVKKTARKATGQDPLPEDTAAEATPETPADGGPVVEAAPEPAKKTTRRRTTKKSAAPQPDLLTPDSPLTDGPVADAEEDEDAQSEDTAAETDDTSSAGDDQASVTTSAPKSITTTGTSYVSLGGPSSSTPTAEETPEETPEAPTRRSRRRAPVAAPIFQAPVEVAPQAASTSPVEATPEAEAPRKRTRSRRGAAADAAPVADAQAADELTDGPGTAADTDEQPSTSRRRRSRRGRDAEEVAADRAEPVLEAARELSADDATVADVDVEAEADDSDGDEGGEGTRRRRRRRGGRRRRKSGEGAEDSADENDEDENDDEPADEAEADAEDTDQSEDDAEGSGSSSRRRRRRRRRKGEDAASAPDDPDEIVVRVREPRSKNTANEITAVEGSTRLEAKKQRRREGRAAGRRRAPIVTEAEFLARRESVERAMVIRARGDLTQIAVSEDNVLVEHYVAQEEQVSLIGNVYLGRVQNVLPSMEAAFIDIGKGRNAVLYAGEVDWNTLGGGNGPRKIESVLKSGQAVLVQVTKDPIGHKGARLTNQISLPGRYVVYVPRGGNGGISRKLPDTERSRLKGILKDIVPDEAGVIVRTAAEGATEEELTADVSRLQAYWEDIDKKSKSGQAPQLLHGEPDLLIRVVRDLFTEDFAKLVISGDDAFDQVSEYVSAVAPHLAERVAKWTGDGDVFANFRIDEQIKKALDRKVWLPSGGSLIIDRTEAMTVVDVNTGKFTGSGGNLEETVTKNNLEAAEEIVRQLRLRDIGGIIVIDFIDMVLESNRDLVLRRLVECLGRDRTKHQVAEVTSLGLVQMTRKRIGTGLLEAFGENCDHCGGRGLILHDEPKESRRRQDGRGGAEQKNGHDHKNGTGDGEGKKGSRRNRGKGRRDDEHTETPEPVQHNSDAAQRLAQIAAATVNGNAGNGHGTSEPATEPATEAPAAEDRGNGPADRTDGSAGSGAEAGADAGTGEATAEPTDAAEPNGSSRSSRRRRSSRSRSKSAGDEGGSAPDSGGEAPVELVSSGR